MNIQIIVSSALAVLLAADAAAQTARVTAMRVTPLAAANANDGAPREHDGAPRERRDVSTDSVRDARFGAVNHDLAIGIMPGTLAVYPVAGTSNRDWAIPYFVDVEPSPSIRDFNCTRRTFDEHKGHDPYIRSFREQAIGVPVFAARDGVVVDLLDGQPDENTNNDPTMRANFVRLRHNNHEETDYVHLRRDSITVARGDYVTAGTQIGMVGSSGISVAPHIHFEMRFNGEAVEPMSGPCRPGTSYMPEQEFVTDTPLAFGATFSKLSFEGFRPPPFDDAPHTGTFVRGQQTIYFKAELSNINASTQYRLTLDPPGSTGEVLAASGRLTSWDLTLAAIWWALEVDLNRTGTWTLNLEANDQKLLSVPFEVVASQSEVVNRAPSAYSVALEPQTIVADRVPVCRVTGNLIADPDFDVVSYHYTWTVNGTVVRDVTTAARSDALARQHVTNGSQLSCTVVASDGSLSTQPLTAHADVKAARRRAVRK